MSATTLLVGAGTATVSAIIYGFVGRTIAQRKVTTDAALANGMFVTWWYGLAGLTLVGAAESAAAAFGWNNLALYEALLNALVVVLFLALFALAYYLIFLYTGKKKILAPLLVFYVAFYVYFAYLVAAADPVAVKQNRWTVGVEYENPDIIEGNTLLLLLLLVPEVLGAVGYFSLYFKVDDPTVRYRIAVVSWAIIGWFGTSIVASLTGLNRTYEEWWPMVSRGVGLVAALAILAAYRPPTWVQRRWGVRAVTGASA